MEVIYGLLPGMVILGLVAVGVFVWAARSGQFDDMDGDASRILLDEDEDTAPPPDSTEQVSTEAADAGDSVKTANEEPKDP